LRDKISKYGATGLPKEPEVPADADDNFGDDDDLEILFSNFSSVPCLSTLVGLHRGYNLPQQYIKAGVIATKLPNNYPHTEL